MKRARLVGAACAALVMALSAAPAHAAPAGPDAQLGSFAIVASDGSPIPTPAELANAQMRERALGIATEPAPVSQAVTTTTFYYSRAQVENMWTAMNNIDNVCKILPLPYFYSLGCTAPANLREAISSAHYQQKRIRAVYYNCGFNYCSYYRYYVIA